MKCPHCEETLAMAERQGIEIDYCPSCRGVWLDRGELDKIIERSTADAGSGPSRDPRELAARAKERLGGKSQYKHSHKKKKKKDFLEDIFDFF